MLEHDLGNRLILASALGALFLRVDDDVDVVPRQREARNADHVVNAHRHRSFAFRDDRGQSAL